MTEEVARTYRQALRDITEGLTTKEQVEAVVFPTKFIIMPKQSPTEVTLDMICREIKELKEEQKQLRADINKGKGAIWLLDC
jgi:cell division protein YceG involved in septum cleavage